MGVCDNDIWLTFVNEIISVDGAGSFLEIAGITICSTKVLLNYHILLNILNFFVLFPFLFGHNIMLAYK